MTRVRSLVLVPWIAACGVDFSEPLVDTAANISVALALSDSAPAGEMRLWGQLWPGYGATGAVRAPADSFLRVMDKLVAPYHGYVTGTPSDVLYADTWALNPEVAPGPVEVSGPALEDLGEEAPLLRLTPPWRVGPADRTLSPGATLRLELATLSETADSVGGWWRLDVLKDGRSVALMSADGPVPPAVEIPWAMLSALADRGQVHLTSYQSVATPAPGRRYRGFLSLLTKHVWFVTVEP